VLLALTSLVIFLVGKDELSLSKIEYIIKDYIEICSERKRKISKKDQEELDRLKINPYSLLKSYMIKKLYPYIIPYLPRAYKKGYNEEVF